MCTGADAPVRDPVMEMKMQISGQRGTRSIVILGPFLCSMLLVQVAASADEPISIGISPGAFAGQTAVKDVELKDIAGKADVSQSVVANNTSVVANNSVNGQSTTGTVTFANDAFQNLHGLAVVSANSGNNVSINSSLNVTISLQR